jgi:hypothetical protein
MALSFRPDTAPLLVLVENKNAVAHDHSEQGGWGLEWIMPAAIYLRTTISLDLLGIIGQRIQRSMP